MIIFFISIDPAELKSFNVKTLASLLLKADLPCRYTHSAQSTNKKQALSVERRVFTL
jgi:hypothetical protein